MTAMLLPFRYSNFVYMTEQEFEETRKRLDENGMGSLPDFYILLTLRHLTEEYTKGLARRRRGRRSKY